MSGLRIFDDNAPGALMLETDDAALIAERLRAIGVRFERWDSPVTLPPDADADTILEAYRPYLDKLMGETGAGSADVIKMTPDHPQAGALREKFLNEHLHTEDEVRFFVSGSGHFVLHTEGKIFDALCTTGDLISVPANTRHWFDAGEHPDFTALRIFTDPSGWVAHFTGEAISARFPVA
ncbi:1,2-dihydroxy-3-keto-5-methylthiopentene dioxygenase [Acidiphilium sp.]|uniref:1,2-dihydroxy-3-keto-5-methylthiopentene dioxygenase n=1 Tax=Acidiphilium sp. TaxID=527 RepID=UPI003CFFDDBB